MLLLSTAYFPPIEYFAYLAKCSIYIEAQENYEKQSYRNRCRILTGQGVEDLRVPIVHNGARKITEILVDYSTPWVRQTKYAIETAYSSSPFFEYYKDQLFAILDSHPETLWDLDLQLIRFFCAKIGINPDIRFTEEYICAVSAESPDHSTDSLHPLPHESLIDMRASIHPKRPLDYHGREYWQVFKDRFGFIPNLSIMDLLFNEGPESLGYLL